MKNINGTLCYTGSEILNGTTLGLYYIGNYQTWRRVRILSRSGYLFISGNNPGLGNTCKWSEYHPIRVAQTSSRQHGFCIQTLWAIHDETVGTPFGYNERIEGW